MGRIAFGLSPGVVILHSEKVSDTILNMNEEHLVQNKNIQALSTGAELVVYADTIRLQESLMQ